MFIGGGAIMDIYGLTGCGNCYYALVQAVIVSTYEEHLDTYEVPITRYQASELAEDENLIAEERFLETIRYFLEGQERNVKSIWLWLISENSFVNGGADLITTTDNEFLSDVLDIEYLNVNMTIH